MCRLSYLCGAIFISRRLPQRIQNPAASPPRNIVPPDQRGPSPEQASKGQDVASVADQIIALHAAIAGPRQSNGTTPTYF